MTSPSPIAAMDLSLLWTQGDWVTRSVALLLLAMSIATWSVIALKSWDLWRARRQAAGAEQFWHSASLPEGMRHLGASDSPFHQLATQGQEAHAHHRQNANELHGSLSASDWISMCLRNSMDGSQARMQSGLSILASIGSTAPFVGLFGTVWGIMNSFIGIAQTQTTNLAVVAPGIAEALLATAIGLFAAIPAVVIYNIFARMIGSYKASLGDVAAQVLLLQSRDLDLSASGVKPVRSAQKLRVG